MSQEAIIGISSVMPNVLLICLKCLELKKKDKILDVIVSLRIEETIRERKQEVVETGGEAKLIGNHSKEIKSAIENKRKKVYSSHQQNQTCRCFSNKKKNSDKGIL